jgi:hypothetical protein
MIFKTGVKIYQLSEKTTLRKMSYLPAWRGTGKAGVFGRVFGEMSG